MSDLQFIYVSELLCGKYLYTHLMNKVGNITGKLMKVIEVSRNFAQKLFNTLIPMNHKKP